MEHAKQHPVLSAFKFVFSLTLITLLFWVCNSGDKKQEPVADGAATFKMNCVRIDSAQIQAWVDAGWTKPDSAKKILLQFFSADAPKAGSNMKLLAFPGKSYLEIYSKGRLESSIDSVCGPKELDGKATLGNNYANLADLKILKGDGKLVSFSFLRFIPKQGVYGDYVTFSIEVVQVVKGKEIILEAKGTDPCPHYCS